MLTNYQNKINLVTPSTWFCFPSHNRLPLEERLGKSYSATVWHNALGYSSSVMTQLIWNSAKDEVWLQTFKASEDVPTHAARPAVSEFAVTVQSQKSHKLHTWAHNCRHTPVSLKFKAGVKPIKGHFISFLLLGGVWASTIKATSTSAGASTSRGPCQPFEKGNARASVIPWHHTVPVVLECAGLKTNPQPGQYWNSKRNLGRIYHRLPTSSKATPDAVSPAVLRLLPALACTDTGDPQTWGDRGAGAGRALGCCWTPQQIVGIP